MKKIYALILLLAANYAVAQNPSGSDFSEYQIAETDCHVFLPDMPEEWAKTTSEKGTVVYNSVVVNGEWEYRVILVKYGTLDFIGDMNYFEKELIEYLGYLKGELTVVESDGYKTGYTLGDTSKTIGVSDYWKTSQLRLYRVKAWVNTKYMAILMVGGGVDPLSDSSTAYFLDGISFPENYKD